MDLGSSAKTKPAGSETAATTGEGKGKPARAAATEAVGSLRQDKSPQFSAKGCPWPLSADSAAAVWVSGAISCPS